MTAIYNDIKISFAQAARGARKLMNLRMLQYFFQILTLSQNNKFFKNKALKDQDFYSH